MFIQVLQKCLDFQIFLDFLIFFGFSENWYIDIGVGIGTVIGM